MYYCERCGYETNVLCNMKTHLKRKTPCKSTNCDVSPAILLESLMKKDACICEDCGAEFASTKSKYNHKKLHCNKGVNANLHQVITNLQKEIKELKEGRDGKGSTIINQQNNVGQQININLKDFGQENMDYITKEFLNSCLLSYDIVPLIETIHCDKDHPENHNVRIKSMRYDIMEHYEDGRWIMTDKEETLDELVKKGYRVLKYHSRKHKDELIEDRELDEDEFEDVVEWLESLYDDKKARKPIKKKLILMFMNNNRVTKTLLLGKE